MYELLNNYESFLAFGKNSDNNIVKGIAKALKHDVVSASTIGQSITALNNFLEESEAFRVACIQLKEAGILDNGQNYSASSLIRIGKSTPRDAIKEAVRQSSWFAACLAGGMKTIKQKHLKVKSEPSDTIYADEFGGDEKTFPLDKAVTLIKSAPNIRDKLLWSLLAASGIRISEALTMFKSDVKITLKPIKDRQKNKPIVTSKNVYVIDPATRLTELSKYMSEEEINRLPHKGRETPDTQMIEPFASLFWLYLDKYNEDEKKKQQKRGIVIDHPFLFRNLRSGESMVNSYQAVWGTFNKAAKKVTNESYGFHSLRHMYAYYLHNFAPMANGTFGLELKQVQILLGHASIKSTQRYARQDQMKLTAAMSALNMARSNNSHFSVTNARIEFLKQEIKRLELENKTEGGNS